MDKEKIRDLISQMTLEEKAGMCSGADFWHTKAAERLGIPSVMVSDGPHGLRKQSEAADHLGINDSIKAVCFPAGCALASSFDRDLAKKMGETIGQECQAEDISTILGPAVNIKRSPLCGRNFEYYSEDPYAASEMSAAFIRGVQSKNVGTSVKHFLANNQEKRRMTNSSDVDERTLREIYMVPFEGAVKNGKPWTVMNSYNQINGTFVGESKEYLTDLLRAEWGFDGYVMSDWGAVNDRVEALKAGMDLEMPSSNGVNDTLIVKAVQDGTLDEAVVDDTLNTFASVSASRVLENVTASDYGFDAPLGEIRLIADGAETVFTIGMYNEMTGEYYVLINDDHSKVYVVDQTLYNITKKTASDFEAEVSEDGTEDSASENGGAKE